MIPLTSSVLFLSFIHLLKVLHWPEMGHVFWCLLVWGLTCGFFLTSFLLLRVLLLQRTAFNVLGDLFQATDFRFHLSFIKLKKPKIHNDETKHYQAAKIMLQLYMNLLTLVYQVNLLKNCVLCITNMLHNIYDFPGIILFWQDRESNSQGFEKEAGGPNFC